jgi:uncharacterized membrane protein YraQ (UPF0718 family)
MEVAQVARVRRARWQAGTVGVVAAALLLLFALRLLVGDWLDEPRLQTWATIFVAIVLQATPFLAFGVVLSGVIAAFVPPGAIARALPRRPALAVPVAGMAGIALPGCECGSVPIAGRLVAGGVMPPAALTFLLAAPAINPVVLISTAVAFPGRPEVVAARFVASLLTAVVVGWIWIRAGRTEWLDRARRPVVTDASRSETFRATAVHDFLHAGGYLVVGAAVAATLQVAVPRSILDAVGGSGVFAVITLALLSVALSVCSEADAFVAASLTQFSMTSRLTFMVVGPAVDTKLIALQTGVFGRSFASRFAPLTFAIAVASSIAVGTWLL